MCSICSRNITHAVEQLSPMLRLFEPACSRAHEPQLLSLRAAMSEFSTHRACIPEAPRKARALQWKTASAHPEQQNPSAAKNKSIQIIKKKKKECRQKKKGMGWKGNWNYIKKGRTERIKKGNINVIFISFIIDLKDNYW